MTLELKDLMGQLEEVTILGMTQGQKEGKPIYFLDVKDGVDRTISLGIFGDNVAKEILEKHGSLKGKKKMLLVPSSKLQEGGMNWINTVY